MGVVEVVVAMFVFSIIAAGIAASTMTVNRLTQDSRSREAATNLAARDLDAARAVGDPSDVHSGTTTWTDRNGRQYRIARTATWVSTSGTDTNCGSATIGRFRRVNVSVDWDGRLSTTSPVLSNTLIAPPAAATDITVGAITVRVIGANGLPQPGVKVTVIPTTGGRALTSQPDATDSEGCTHADRVIPGVYTIQLQHDGWISSDQQETPTNAAAAVAAGTTVAWSVQYDAWATAKTNYATNFSGLPSPLLPAELTTTIEPDNSTFPIFVDPAPASSTLHLHPLGGYSAVAGTYARSRSATDCASVDPKQWAADPTRNLRQGVRATASASAGGTPTFSYRTNSGTTVNGIPMGVVQVTGQSGKSLTAVPATAAGPGNPGCTAPQVASYSFGKAASDSVYLALPFGSWQISADGSTLSSSKLTLTRSGGANAITSNKVVTFDPREVVP